MHLVNDILHIFGFEIKAENLFRWNGANSPFGYIHDICCEKVRGTFYYLLTNELNNTQALPRLTSRRRQGHFLNGNHLTAWSNVITWCFGKEWISTHHKLIPTIISAGVVENKTKHYMSYLINNIYCMSLSLMSKIWFRAFKYRGKIV